MDSRLAFRVETSPVLKRMDKLLAAMGRRGLRRTVTAAAEKIHASQTDAFQSKTDPKTGAPWAPQKETEPWPLMEHTGTLRSLLGSKIKVLDRVAFAKGIVRDATTLDGRSYHIIANTLNFGRKDKTTPGRRWSGLSSRDQWYISRAANEVISKASK